MKVLLTGAAGFIGMHCAQRLLARGDDVFGIDNLSPYYPIKLKRDRLKQLATTKRFHFFKIDLAQPRSVERIFRKARPQLVLHLAAQPGVRHSLENPSACVQSNLVGFANLLDCCRRHPPEHLVFASSSSVYGSNPKLPWTESDNVDHPVSLYAATKKANELMAHVYSHLYRVPATGLRYFTIYGPWGRPDMSPVLFARAIMEGKPVAVFNRGDMQRDFTYIDDAVEATLRALDRPAGYSIYNVGNHSPVRLTDYIAALEKALGKSARLEMKPMQPGDIKASCADTSALLKAVGFAPSTPLATGLARFAAWFRDYYRYG